ncbi:hypothetical protein FOXG_20404 [Fusarium oxysporum f. sp. lycopersici 4287]|uniref:Uncharacterized protein n=2 Tax=Fusarium oxysporum TaxID=5507 RepID=A0A0J9VJ33_FUSO4|nr:hypothetical protein FOXG_20404 [Fusarium oxysporum f. sp. lycopersici 4287]EXK46402.1 hypothetical protein FOMG_00124 [Fusarium oxysporum f. sp. melonis 26406]KNB10791.1 hypothetical protein FOXG_20404 [Fusarium oxysporum f. sp. lycopersici 4287]
MSGHSEGCPVPTTAEGGFESQTLGTIFKRLQ